MNDPATAIAAWQDALARFTQPIPTGPSGGQWVFRERFHGSHETDRCDPGSYSRTYKLRMDAVILWAGQMAGGLENLEPLEYHNHFGRDEADRWRKLLKKSRRKPL